MTNYKVILSTGKAEIILDQEDYEKMTNNMGGGNLIRVKQAIINPSFIVAVIPFEVEKKKEVEGFIDEKRGVFVITAEKEKPMLVDKFKPDVKSLAESKQV